MLDLVTTAQFRKDLKRIRKRCYDLSKLDEILQKLRAEEPLPEKNRDHDLTGDYKGFRECHVEPDWLLVYAVDKESLAGTRLKATHINLLDGTIEGVRCEADRVFSVQYHPESAPGPQDSAYLFDNFIRMMEEARKHA